MFSFLRTFFFVILLLPSTGYAESRSYIFGISPFLSADDRRSVEAVIFQFALEGAKLGDSVHVIDAYNNKPITNFSIPNESVYSSSKARVNFLKSSILNIKGFFRDSTFNVVSENGGIRSDLTGAIKMPQFLDFVANNIITPNEKLHSSVILIGSPLYIDTQEPSFSMTDAFFPSDGHILTDIKNSVFSTRGRKDFLKGVKIYYSYLHSPWISDIHEKMIHRFWSLFLGQQGGRLLTFIPDLGTTMKRVGDTSDEIQGQVFQINAEDSKIEFRRIIRNPGDGIDWLISPRGQSGPPPSLSRKGKLLVGIKWDCPRCDFDLYTKSSDASDWLYYGKKTTNEGLYYKDFTTSPNAENGYEYVEYSNPVDPRNIMVAVNFFSGQTSSAKGEVRILYNDVSYYGDFSIASSTGNGGVDRDNMSRSNYWAVLNIKQILGIR